MSSNIERMRNWVSSGHTATKTLENKKTKEMKKKNYILF